MYFIFKNFYLSLLLNFLKNDINSFNDEKIKIESSQLDNIYLNERNTFFSEIGIVSTLTLI